MADAPSNLICDADEKAFIEVINLDFSPKDFMLSTYIKGNNSSSNKSSNASTDFFDRDDKQDNDDAKLLLDTLCCSSDLVNINNDLNKEKENEEIVLLIKKPRSSINSASIKSSNKINMKGRILIDSSNLNKGLRKTLLGISNEICE